MNALVDLLFSPFVLFHSRYLFRFLSLADSVPYFYDSLSFSGVRYFCSSLKDSFGLGIRFSLSCGKVSTFLLVWLLFYFSFHHLIRQEFHNILGQTAFVPTMARQHGVLVFVASARTCIRMYVRTCDWRLWHNIDDAALSSVSEWILLLVYEWVWKFFLNYVSRLW